MKFLFVFALCVKDMPAARRSAALVHKFGPYDCDLLLQPTQDVPKSGVKEIEDLLVPQFASSRTVPPFDEAPQTWPAGPNHLFKRATKFVQDSEFDAFYFWEPDCLPLKKGWLQALVKEYEESGKPFMGVIYPTKLRHPDGREEISGNHMVGTGIYPKDTWRLAPNSLLPTNLAWDVAAQDEIVPLTKHTELIQHNWSTAQYHSLEQLRPDAVVHHGCKDDTLYRLLTGELQSDGVSGEPVPVGNNKGKSEPKAASSAVCQPTMFQDVSSMKMPEVGHEENTPSTHDAVLPHVIAMLQALCVDAVARRKIQKVLQKECLLPKSGRAGTTSRRAA